jgi:hypothetical protein
LEVDSGTHVTEHTAMRRPVAREPYPRLEENARVVASDAET